MILGFAQNLQDLENVVVVVLVNLNTKVVVIIRLKDVLYRLAVFVSNVREAMFDQGPIVSGIAPISLNEVFNVFISILHLLLLFNLIIMIYKIR